MCKMSSVLPTACGDAVKYALHRGTVNPVASGFNYNITIVTTVRSSFSNIYFAQQKNPKQNGS